MLISHVASNSDFAHLKQMHLLKGIINTCEAQDLKLKSRMWESDDFITKKALQSKASDVAIHTHEALRFVQASLTHEYLHYMDVLLFTIFR